MMARYRKICEYKCFIVAKDEAAGNFFAVPPMNMALDWRPDIHEAYASLVKRRIREAVRAYESAGRPKDAKTKGSTNYMALIPGGSILVVADLNQARLCSRLFALTGRYVEIYPTKSSVNAEFLAEEINDFERRLYA